MTTIGTIFRDAVAAGQIAIINGSCACPKEVLEALAGKGVLPYRADLGADGYLLPGGNTVKFVTPTFLRLPDDHPHRQKTLLRSTLAAIAAADPEQHVFKFFGEWVLLCVIEEGLLLQTGDHYLFRRAEVFERHCRLIRELQDASRKDDAEETVIPFFHGFMQPESRVLN